MQFLLPHCRRAVRGGAQRHCEEGGALPGYYAPHPQEVTNTCTPTPLPACCQEVMPSTIPSAIVKEVQYPAITHLTPRRLIHVHLPYCGRAVRGDAQRHAQR